MNYTKYIYKKYDIDKGKKLVIYDFDGNLKEIPNEVYNSNVELIDTDGKILWKIQSQGKSNSNFVGAHIKDNYIELMNFEGFAFKLSLETGSIERLDWRK
jgi:hypothetical protein